MAKGGGGGKGGKGAKGKGSRKVPAKAARGGGGGGGATTDVLRNPKDAAKIAAKIEADYDKTTNRLDNVARGKQVGVAANNKPRADANALRVKREDAVVALKALAGATKSKTMYTASAMKGFKERAQKAVNAYRAKAKSIKDTDYGE